VNAPHDVEFFEKMMVHESGGRDHVQAVGAFVGAPCLRLWTGSVKVIVVFLIGTRRARLCHRERGASQTFAIVYQRTVVVDGDVGDADPFAKPWRAG